MNGSSEHFAANEQRPRRGATPHDACAPRDGGPQTGPETARARPGLRRIWPRALPIALSGLAVGLLLVFVGLLAVPGQVGAQGVTTLVSHLNQGNDDIATFAVAAVVAQQFTAGSNTGGHALTGIDVDSDKGHANSVNATGAPTVTGTPEKGETLTAGIGTIADTDGLPDTFPNDYAFQWIRVDGMTETDISGANSSTYTLVAEDVDKQVKVRVSFTDDDNSGEMLTSDAYPSSGSIETPKNATGRPAITLYVTVDGVPTIPYSLNPYVAQVGYKLVVDEGTIDDPDGRPVWCVRNHPPDLKPPYDPNDTYDPNDLSCTHDPDDEYDIQWIRVDGDTETDIDGATEKEYRVQRADLGKRLRVRVSFEDDNGNEESRESLKSPRVVRKEQSCSSRQGHDWCRKLWAWNRYDTFYGYQAIGKYGVGLLSKDPVGDPPETDRTIGPDGERLNLVGRVGMADNKNSRDKIKLGLSIARWLPYGTVFNIGGINFPAHKGTTSLVGQYQWDRPSYMRITRGQWVTISAKIRDAQLSVSDTVAPEATDRSLAFVVTLSPKAAGEVTVDYATSDGTATAGDDYTAVDGTLTFEPGQTRKTVLVPTIVDTVDDEGETMTLTLSEPSGAAISDSEGVGTIRIPDPLTAEFQQAPASHDGTTAFTVQLSFSEDIATGYLALRDRAVSADGGTVRKAKRVNGQDDLWQITVEPSGNDDVTLSIGPSPTDCTAADAVCTFVGTALTGTATATVTGPTTVSVADASATEGAALTFAVSLSNASGQRVTVQYATASGTATSGTDFTAVSNTLTFEANETAKTVTVATTDDSVDEDDETFTLTLSDPTNAALGDATATGTINDNDTSPLTASFSGMPLAHRGEAFTFTLNFSEDVDRLGIMRVKEAFDVTGASVTKAKRHTRGSNESWMITVEPSSATDLVTITLPETTDCNASGAICTSDSRPLSNSTTRHVAPLAS